MAGKTRKLKASPKEKVRYRIFLSTLLLSHKYFLSSTSLLLTKSFVTYNVYCRQKVETSFAALCIFLLLLQGNWVGFGYGSKAVDRTHPIQPHEYSRHRFTAVPNEILCQREWGCGGIFLPLQQKSTRVACQIYSYFYYAAPALVLNFSNRMLFPLFLKCKSSHPTNPLHWVFLPMFFTQRPIRHQNKISKRSGGGGANLSRICRTLLTSNFVF